MTVAELITHLQKFGSDTPIIVDWDGDTSSLRPNIIRLWDEDDPNSPVAFFL